MMVISGSWNNEVLSQMVAKYQVMAHVHQTWTLLIGLLDIPALKASKPQYVSTATFSFICQTAL